MRRFCGAGRPPCSRASARRAQAFDIRPLWRRFASVQLTTPKTWLHPAKLHSYKQKDARLRPAWPIANRPQVANLPHNKRFVQTGSGLLWWLVAALPASAHVISMSNGFATVTGSHVEYILRMPDYEIAQLKDPARALFDHIRFTSGFETARRLDGECHDDPSTSTLICAANYQFSGPVENLGVDCTYYDVTVPNHIHLLRAEKDAKYDQAILDSSFPSSTLAFRPPTAVETAVGESLAGTMRVWTNLTQMLLLIALALASRSRKELALLVAAFLLGECGGTAILIRTLWQPPLRFAEAAAALALAYLALEVLAFPKSGGRWVLAVLFGGFQAMFFALFVSESGYHAGWVLAGACFAALAVATVCAIPKPGVTLRRIAASTFLATGIVWFCLRLRS